MFPWLRIFGALGMEISAFGMGVSPLAIELVYNLGCCEICS